MSDIFIIDDDPGSSYIENVVELLESEGKSVTVIEDISRARESIQDILKSGIVVLDLMMPETDQKRLVPEDPCAVGISFCEELIARGYGGVIAVLTNATPGRHASNLERLSTLLNKRPGAKRITYKYHAPSLEFVAKLIHRGEV